MKITPFWGCMIPLKYPQMESAIRFSAAALGIEFVETNRFSCCPDPIYFKAGDKMMWYTLAARNLAIAEQMGHDIVTMCSGCTSTLCEVNYHLKNNRKLRSKVNKRLAKVGLEFQGTISVRHIVTLLRDDIGLDSVNQSVRYPITDLKVAIHYGCHLLKPSEIMQVEDPMVPSILYDLFRAIGTTPIHHYEYLTCCGKAATDRDIGLNMSHALFRSIVDSEADCLGLICPTCFDSFDLGQLRVTRHFNEPFEIPVFYYFQLLALAQGAPVETVGLQYHKMMPENIQDRLVNMIAQ